MTTTKTAAKIKAGKVTMEEIKPKALEVVDNELVVFGNKISRHPKFPWLFRVTDVHKACARPIKQTAIKKGKDPEKTFKSKAPAQYMKNVSEEKIDAVAFRLRARIKKHGLDCELRGYDNVTEEEIREVSNRDLCIRILMGGATKGENIAVQGTYVCQDLIISYALFLGFPKIADILISKTPEENNVSIYKHKKKAETSRLEHQFAFHLEIIAKAFNMTLRKQLKVLNYRLDFVFLETSGRRWIIEYDEKYHEADSQVEADEIRVEKVVEHLRKKGRIKERGLLLARCKQGEEKEFLSELIKKLRGKTSSLSTQEFFA